MDELKCMISSLLVTALIPTLEKNHGDEVSEFLNLGVWRTPIKAPESLKMPKMNMFLFLYHDLHICFCLR